MTFEVLIVKSRVNEDMYCTIRSSLNKSPVSDGIFLVLDTPGGDQMYAYRTMKYLDNLYKDKLVYVVIPDMAMSAGTLMALGADKIFMFPDSCMGPLDPQKPHPEDDTMISTLDIRDAISTIAAQTAAATRIILQDNLEVGMPKTLAIKLATDSAVKLFQPITGKIDPYHLNESVRVSELNSMYGARLLMMRMTKGNPSKAISISSDLTNNYMFHGYAITLDEALSKGLEVEDLSCLPGWTQIERIYRKTQKPGIAVDNINISHEPKVNKQKTQKEKEVKND